MISSDHQIFDVDGFIWFLVVCLVFKGFNRSYIISKENCKWKLILTKMSNLFSQLLYTSFFTVPVIVILWENEGLNEMLTILQPAKVFTNTILLTKKSNHTYKVCKNKVLRPLYYTMKIQFSSQLKSVIVTKIREIKILIFLIIVFKW